MAEEAKPSTPIEAKKDGGEDIKNLKAEFDRKIGNIEKTNQALLNQLQVLNQPKKEPAKEAKTPFKDLWYDDPDAAATLIAKKAKDDTLSEIRAENLIQQRKGNVIQQLYREYPELQDFDNPLTTKAVEIFEKLTDEEKSNPIAYRLAVKEAAEELDIKPKAKRKAKEEDDSFSLSGTADKAPRTRGKREGGLDPRTVKFAKLVGLDTDNEKVIESLKNRSERKSWMTWE